MSKASSLECECVSKTFRRLSARVLVEALREISFKVHTGEVLAILGENGSGKSTLLRIIATLSKPTSGKITLFGNDLVHHPRRVRSLIGYLPETPQFHRGVSGRVFLTYLAKLRGVRSLRDTVSKNLDRFKLPDKWANLPVETYSEGMRERLGLAAAFLANPAVLILDEPLENLDRNFRSHVLTSLQEEKEGGKMILLASHNQDLIRSIVTKEIHLHEGVIQS